MSAVATEVLLILLLLAVNGLFAMTEIAVVSARKARLRRLAEQGDAKAAAALALAGSPNRFLATVQIGITLVGVLAGAFGGATIAQEIAAGLARFPALASYGEAISLGLVVVAITFLSLVLGELVPKRIGLNNPERIARLMAAPMHRLARLASPLVRLLAASTDLMLRLLRQRPPTEPAIDEDDVRDLVREGVRSGVFDRREPAMVAGVLALDRLAVSAIMTPRAQFIWLNRDAPHEVLWHKIVVSGHSRFPVYEGTRDRVVGVLSLKSVYANLAAGLPARIADLMVSPLFVDESRCAATLLELFKRTRHRVAFVTNASGQVVGLVTMHDVMEAIVGDLPSPADRLKPQAFQRTDGSWLMDGAVSLDMAEALLGKLHFPDQDRRATPTLADFVQRRLTRPPAEGDTLAWQGLGFEILDLDGSRIDKILVTARIAGDGAPHEPPPN